MPRRLVVMRHAKAEAGGATDFERPLAERGRRDATDAGRWLAGQGIAPEHALVSAALRTRETWAAVAEGASWSLEADVDRGLYDAGPETALDLICRTPAPAGTLIVVGHNPTMAYLVQLLDSGAGEPGASDALAGGFPTSAVAVFAYDGAWADLGSGAADLVATYVGRG